ncbi:chemotaxis response regulator protein-glutamate methylesterase [Chitinimonas sp. BJYL2]|uniref:protein-glutamate methylesterase/protein-glutamine glutaminase n=1 Tax=Chitinimonas sp. BJYL2 TaxID=2976696 RepID=UPI0022B45098|nr:chemotaxis response regulator protein-glutamate methylesterase [Chitinimonas sp. BJYL2]
MKKVIRIVVVDDSPLMRKLLTEIINSESDMEVVGAAPDPLAARELIRALSPDAITLDIEMPKMNGLEFLDKLMRLKPTPVVMISTLTAEGSGTALKALELGAVDCVAKPRSDLSRGLRDMAEDIVEKLRTAANARISRSLPRPASTAPVPPRPKRPGVSSAAQHNRLIAIGASTGGTQALQTFLVELPADIPPIVVVQHMPPAFTRPFANRLDGLCAVKVKEAEHGERLRPGHVYIAPGDYHLALTRDTGHLACQLLATERVNRHRPAADVLFDSVAALCGKRAVGVIMTGMGNDGAAGMLAMKQAGAYNFAQDEDSCVVFGMPKEAIKAGGVDEILPLDDLAGAVLRQLGAE